MSKPWEQDWHASSGSNGDESDGGKPWEKEWTSGPSDNPETDQPAGGGLADAQPTSTPDPDRPGGPFGGSMAPDGTSVPGSEPAGDAGDKGPSDVELGRARAEHRAYEASTTFGEATSERLATGARNLDIAGEAISLMRNYRQANRSRQKVEALQVEAEKAKEALQKRKDIPRDQRDAMIQRVENRIAGYQKQLEQSRQQFRRNLTEIAKNQKANREATANPIAERAVSSETFDEFWTYFKEDPLGVIGQIGTESAPLMAPGLVAGAAGATGGGLVGGPAGASAGFAAGQGAGSGGVEFALSLVDGLREHGADLSDPESVKRTLAEHGDEIRAQAKKRGLAIGAFDAAGGKLATVGLVPRAAKGAGRSAQVARETAEATAQTGAQATTGASGEASAQLATGESLHAGEIAAEAAGETITAPAEVGTAAVTGARNRGRMKDGEQRQRTEQEQADLDEFEQFMEQRRQERGAPGLPAPVVEVDSSGQARTQAQGEQQRASEAQENEELGLTPDVRRAQRRRTDQGAPGESAAQRGAQAREALRSSATDQRSREKLAKRAKRYEELAANEEDPEIARDLRQQARNLRDQFDADKPKETPEQRRRRQKRVNEEKDDLLTAIQKLGGINTTTETDWAGRLKGQEPITQPGFNKLERSQPGQGNTLDELAEALHERGYLESHDQAELEQKLLQAEKGNPVYSKSADEAAMIDAMEEAEARPVSDEEAELADAERDRLEEALAEYAQMPPEEAGDIGGVNVALQELQERAERMDPDATEQAVEAAGKEGDNDQAFARRLLDVIEEARASMERRATDTTDADESGRRSGERVGGRRQQVTKRDAIERHLDEVQDLDDAKEIIGALREDRRTVKVGGKDIEGVGNIVEHADREAKGELKQYQGFLDLDNFKALNDTLGHATADNLIRQFAEGLKRYVGEGNLFHRSGDEFIVQGDDKAQLEAALAQAQQDFESNAGFVLELPDGGSIERNQVRFSYGVAENVDNAEKQQDRQKQQRKEAGLRYERDEDSEGQPAGEAGSAEAGPDGSDQPGSAGPERPARDEDQPQLAEDSEGQVDLAGGKSETAQAEKDADEERAQKAADSPPVESGPGDLFSGADKQPDIFDQPAESSEAPAEPGASSFGGPHNYGEAESLIERLEEAGADRTAKRLRDVLNDTRQKGSPFPQVTLDNYNRPGAVENAAKRDAAKKGTDPETRALSESGDWSAQFNVPDTHFPAEIAAQAAEQKRRAEANGDEDTANEIEFAVSRYHAARERSDDTAATQQMNRLRDALGMERETPELNDLAPYKNHRGIGAKRASKFLRDRGLSESAATDPNFSVTMRDGKTRIFRGPDSLTIKDDELGSAEFSVDEHGVMELIDGRKYDLGGAVEGSNAVKDFLRELEHRIGNERSVQVDESRSAHLQNLDQSLPELEKAAEALRRGVDPEDGNPLSGKTLGVRDDLIDTVSHLRERVTNALDQAGAAVDQDTAERADQAIDTARRALAGRVKSRSGGTSQDGAAQQEKPSEDLDAWVKRTKKADPAFKAAYDHHADKYGTAQGFARGWRDAADGMSPNEDRLPLPKPEMSEQGFNPVYGYATGYVSQLKGEHTLVRAINRGGRTAGKVVEEATDQAEADTQAGGAPERTRTQGETPVEPEEGPAEQGASESAAQPTETPLRIEPYSEKSIVVRGDTKPHKDRIKNALGGKPRGLWNNRAGGWIFPRKRADEVRRALADLLPQEADVDAQAQQAATSQQNVQPEPTAAQKEVGNYKTGDLRVQGFDIAVENPKGSYRHNLDERDLQFNAPEAAEPTITALRNGNVPHAFQMLRASTHPMLREIARNAWMVRLKHHYGYFRRTEGNDGDAIDVFVGPNPDSEMAYIVDQTSPGGIEGRRPFDEHKVMLGFDSEEVARQAYLDGFEGELGKRVLGAITPVDVVELRRWLDEGDHSQPYAYKAGGSTPAAVSAQPDLVDELDLQERTRANMAGEPPERAALIALRDVLEAGTDVMNDGGFPAEISQQAGALSNRIDAALESGQVQAVQRDAAETLREWLKRTDLEESVSRDLASIRRTIESQAGAAAGGIEAGDMVVALENTDTFGTEPLKVQWSNGKRIRLKGHGQQTFNATGFRTVEEADGRPRADSPQEQLAVDIADTLRERAHRAGGGTKIISSNELFEMANRVYGGTRAEGAYTSRDAYDAMEAAVNLHLRRRSDLAPTGDAGIAAGNVRAVDDVISALPSQTRRSEEQTQLQQFSTPPTHAHAAAWVANLREGDVVLEPSAGTGSLVAPAQAADARVVANEYDPGRAELLEQFGVPVYREDAQHIDAVLPNDVEPSVVLMNPPFSANLKRPGKKNLQTGARHVEAAMKRLRPGGRLVAIVGRGMRPDAGSQQVQRFWQRVGGQYNVRANVGISGQAYKQYGTTFDNRIVVIDNTAPDQQTPVTGDVESVAELPALLEEVRNERPASAEPQAGTRGGGTRVPQADGRTAGERGAGRARAGGVGAATATDRPRADGGERGGAAGDRAGSDAAQPAEGTARVPGERGTGRPEGSSDSAAVSPAPDGTGRGGEGAGGRAASQGRSDGDRAVSGGDVDAVGVSDAFEANRETELTDDTFESYRPRATFEAAKEHPAKLSESAAMASVKAPKVERQPRIPKEVVEQGRLSNIQLEAVALAGQSHQQQLADGTRRGFYIGDGTGVGKGAEIAGIMLDNWQRGRKKHVWVSENQKLYQDAQRDADWADLGKDKLFAHGDMKGKITAEEGVAFTTYHLLRSKAQDTRDADGNLVSGERRIDQLVAWLGEDFDGVIAFDESHNMANGLESEGERGTQQASQAAIAGMELQDRLPEARVVYVSATGATEVRNLAYAKRLGLWGQDTAFPDVNKFVEQIDAGGVAAMEIVAKDLKSLGLYTSRSLSYEDVSYGALTHELTESQTDAYRKLARAWQKVMQNMDAALLDTANNGEGRADGNAIARARSAFWGAHQRFFNQVITAMKGPSLISDVERRLSEGKSAVLQLVSTNEAVQERRLAEAEKAGLSLDDVDVTPLDILMQYLHNSFPTAKYEKVIDSEGRERSQMVTDAAGNPVEDPDKLAQRDQLMEEMGSLDVPEGILEQLIDHFGTDAVAEVTGRSRRLVRGKKGRELQKRTKRNVQVEIEEFNKGRRRILVFSDAGGTGASYHADRRIENQQKRYHYLVQPGWRADKAVQGFGRTHRSNQAAAPHYSLVSSNLQAEKRFLSSIARRLDQLGALTKGQRDAAGGGVVSSEASLENSFASNAVTTLIYDASRGQAEPVNRQVLEDEMGMHLWDEDGALIETKLPSVPQFLNRLLSLEPERMDEVFHEFDRRVQANIEYARQQGLLDTGMETLRADSVQKVHEQTAQLGDRPGALRYVELETKRDAKLIGYDDLPHNKGDLFFGRNKSSGYLYAFVPTATTTDPKTGELVKQYRRIGPTGADYLPQAQYGKKYDTADDSDAELRAAWQKRVDNAPDKVTSSRHLIVGALLPVWDRLPSDNQRVLRVQTDDGERLLGRELPAKQVRETLSQLGFDRPAQDLSPAAVREAVMDRGAPVKLTNGWQIERRRVDNEPRMEIKGPRGADVQQMKQLGASTEIIAHKTRVFIPTSKAESVLGALFQSKPPQEIVEGQAADEDDAAGGTRFSRVPGGAAQGINIDEARSAAARLMRGWKARPSTYVVQSESGLPGALQREIERAEASGDVRGVLWRGSAYLIADNIPSVRALEETVLHEVIGHYGLRRALGKDAKPLLRQVWMQYGRSGLADVAQRQGLDLSKPEDQLVAAEEKLAELAETGAKPKLLDKLKALLRDWLRRMGFSLQLTDSDLLALVAKARDFVERGRVVRGQDSVLNEARAAYPRDVGEAGPGAEASMFSRHTRSGHFEKPRLYARAPDGSLAGVAEYHKGKWHLWVKREASGRLFDNGPQTATRDTIKAARNHFTGHGLEVTASIPRSEQLKSEELFTDGFDTPAPGTFEYIRYNLQDKYVDLLQVQKSIEQARGGELPDDANAYMKEALYHGRAEERVQRFREERVDPLIKAMHDAGLTAAELDEYLYARHAPERNAAMAEINPDLEDGEGSGMTDAEAEAVMRRFRDEGKMESLQDLAARVDQLVEEHRRLLEFEGLERPETVQAWRQKYEHYVPLRGWVELVEDTSVQTSTRDARGKGFNLFGGRQKAATGRRSKADSPLTHVLANYEAAAVRAEKAKVGRALLRLVEANPNPRLWEIDKVEYERRINPQTGLVESRPKPTWGHGDNELVVKVAGKDHRITLYGTRGVRIAAAMKNMNADQINVLVRAGAAINRWLSWTRTGANPEFIISNFMRDLQTAGINLAGTKADSLKGAILKDVLKARRGIRDAQKGRSSKWVQVYEDFRRAGGKTGWVDSYASTDDAKAALEKRIKRSQRSGAHPLEMLQAGLDYTENVNTAVENAVRLSTFEHARRNGISEQQAASLAKELTVNFNRKGYYGQVMNAAYLFYNAGLQGTTRMLQALGSKKVRKIAYYTVAGSMVTAMGNRIWGGEDDDGIPYYDKLPDWLKSRYFVVMVPGTEGNYVSVPLPYGYNVLHVMGQELAKANEYATGMRDRYDTADSTLRFMASALESFNPLGSEASPAQFVTPTIADPFVQVWENRDWSGRRIYPTGNPFDRSPQPDSHQGWNTTPQAFKAVARGLNDATGGTAVTPGWFDAHPESLERFYEFAVGGLGTFISDSFANVPTKLTQSQDIKSYEVPFLSKVYGESGFRTTRNGYYEALRKIGEAKDELEGAHSRKTDRTEAEVYQAYRPELQVRGLAESTESKLQSLDDKIEAVRKSGAYGSRAKNRRIENLRERKEETMLRFSRAYHEALAQQ